MKEKLIAIGVAVVTIQPYAVNLRAALKYKQPSENNAWRGEGKRKMRRQK